MDTGDVTIGNYIRFNGELCQVVEYQHRTPGNLRAFFQAKMRNLKNGKLVENRFRAGEMVDIIRVDFKTMQFIYLENGMAVCMDKETFEQVYINLEMFGPGAKFLKEGVDVRIAFEEETPITAEAPTFVEMEVTYTEPGLKGDTATNALKPATLESGAKIMVPLFVNIGDKIKVDTRTESFSERVKV